MNPAFPSPCRVLMTADPIGGVWTYALDLARSLSSYGVRIGLATMGARLSRSQRAEAALVGNVDVFESHYKLEWMDNPWNDVACAGEWLLQLERQFRPDVIHLNGFAHASLPWLAPKIVVAHSCVLSWWEAVKSAAAPAEWEQYGRRVREGLGFADVVVAPSHAMLAELHRHYGPLPPSLVIANGRQPLPARQAWKQPHILTAGRLWDEAKNILTLVKAAPELDWPVCVAGDAGTLQGAAMRLSHVDYLGRLTPAQMAACLQRASIYALPARYEPFGLSVLEAAMAGCALVLGDIPSLRENWRGAAEFVSPDDFEGLKRALRKLIHDPYHLMRRAAAARERARRFTPERMGRAYLATYTRLIEERFLPAQFGVNRTGRAARSLAARRPPSRPQRPAQLPPTPSIGRSALRILRPARLPLGACHPARKHPAARAAKGAACAL